MCVLCSRVNVFHRVTSTLYAIVQHMHVVGWAVIVCVCLMKWLGSVLECGAGWRSAHHFTSQQTGQCSFAGLKRALLAAC